jgi:hypothetical protein
MLMHRSLPEGMPDERRHLFAYGSLTQPNVLDAVLGHGHARERLAARLAGYRRVTNDAYPYPYIVSAPGCVVDGVLLLDLSVHDLQELDRYEEVDAGFYCREFVEVEAWGCGPRPMRLQAFTYTAGPGLVATSES